jgi:GntR family transcriptional repressor for pyruvate dehydrogenase complex
MKNDKPKKDAIESDDLFKAEKVKSAVDRVINSIKEALVSGKLLPGDRIPSESELSSRLMISRGSIREAIKILSAFGIVEVRRGDGTYVAESEQKPVFDPLLFSLILSRANMKELVELRELMEIEIVKLIIRNAEDDDLQKIERVIIRMEDRIASGKDISPEQLAGLDVEFHHTMGCATRNRLVEKIYDFILEFFTPTISTAHKNLADSGRTALHDHKRIYKALAARDVEKAVSIIEISIKEWKEFISQDRAR